MNLSDKDIVRDIQSCVEGKCGACSFDEQTACREYLLYGTLDLINRLQADKEALVAGQETLQKCIAEKMAEIERYKGVIKILEKDISVARAEGVKESAHLIIDKSKNGRIYANDIPDYAKEMVGDSE